MSYVARPNGAVAQIPTEAERRKAARRAGRDRPQSPLTPGVIFFFGVLWTLVGSAVLYLLAAWDDDGERLRAFLIIVQFAAWVIGGYLIVIAGIAWAVTIGIRSARDAS